ncbi:MAG: DivIVA domain-containing protein [Gemmatimonadota bacterium]
MLTPADVQAKRFTETRLFRGYDELEVDDFLDEVAATLAALLEENQRLRARPASPGPAGDGPRADPAQAGPAAGGPGA